MFQFSGGGGGVRNLVPRFLTFCNSPLQYLPQITNPKFTLIIVFAKFRVGWVNSVPQHVNKRINKGNTVALIAITDSKKALLKSTVSSGGRYLLVIIIIKKKRDVTKSKGDENQELKL